LARCKLGKKVLEKITFCRRFSSQKFLVVFQAELVFFHFAVLRKVVSTNNNTALTGNQIFRKWHIWNFKVVLVAFG